MSTFEAFLDKFQSSEQLEEWAGKNGLLEVDSVKSKILDLKWNEIRSYLEDESLPIKRKDESQGSKSPKKSKLSDTSSNTVRDQRPSTSNSGFIRDHQTPSTSNEGLVVTDQPGPSTSNKDTVSEHQRPSTSSIYSLTTDNKAYRIDSRISKSFKQKTAVEKTFKVTFNDTENGKKLKDFTSQLKNMFADLLKQGGEEFQPQDKARVYISDSELKNPIVIKPQAIGDLNPDVILEHIARVLQSNSDIKVSEGLNIELGVCRLMGGSGSRSRVMTNIEEDRMKKKSLVTIRNEDNLCLARSIVVGMAYLEFSEAEGEDRGCRERLYNAMRVGDRGRKTRLS